MAGDLVGHGLKPEEIYGAIYQRKPAAHPSAVAQALEGLEYHANGKLATICVGRGSRGEVPALDSEDVLDLVRSVGEVDVVLFLREMETGMCKLSARSKGAYDVQLLASGFGGGGHAKASGAGLAMSLEEAKSKLVDAAMKQAQATGQRGWNG